MDPVTELAQFHKILGDETRLRLVQILAHQAPGRARCVSCLATSLDTTVSNVSQHLKALKDLGLVQASRRGYHVHYGLDHQRVAAYHRLGEELIGQSGLDTIKNHQPEETTMCCQQDKNCKHPDKKPKPEDCTPEQIEECHGKEGKHHCCEEEKA